MKIVIRFLLIIFILCFSGLLFGIGSNSLAELRLENELSERINASLKPIIKDCIVYVDIDLSYNFYDPNSDQMTLDKQTSLPGLPVAKTEDKIPTLDLTDLSPTDVTGKRVTVRVAQDTDDSVIEEISEIVRNIAYINELEGDVINIEKDLNIKSESNSFFNVKNISIIALLALAFFVIVNNLKSGFRIIAKSMRKVKVTNIDQVSGMQSIPLSQSSSSESNNNHTNNLGNRPVKVQLLKDDEEDSPTSFAFLNELSNDNFINILKDENPNEIAIILSQLDADKFDSFFRHYTGDKNAVLKALINLDNVLKLDMKILVVNMYQKYLEAMEKDPYKINKLNTMAKFINNSSPDVANEIFKSIQFFDSDFSQQLSKKIFLIDDILKLKNVQLEQINSEFTHLDMVRFLKCVPDNIRNKFYSQLSERAIMIMKEDIEMLDDFNEETKNLIINQSVNQIRYILNLN